MHKKLWIALIGGALMLLSGCASAAFTALNAFPPAGMAGGAAITENGRVKAAQMGDYTLWVDTERASFEIHSVSGTVWKSLPEHYDDPDWVNSMLSNNLASILNVTALDADYAAQVLPCYEFCVKNGDVSYETIPGGVRFIFRYAAQGITVPVDIVLTESGFKVEITPEGIREDGEYLVNHLLLLPYFNSGTSEDDGFIFYPDGSGAVAEYGGIFNNAADITQPVYGFDRGIGWVESVSQAYGYRMPVYGAKTNDASYLAIIEERTAFVSSVQTGVERINNRYFKNGVIFMFRDVGRVYLRENQTTVSTAYTIPAPVTVSVPLSADYILLEGEAVDYTHMAAVYRAWLEKTGVFTQLKTETANAHLTLTGAVTKQGSFLGVPTDRLTAFTTFEQAGEIIRALNAAGYGTVAARYIGAQTGGVYGSWTADFTLERKLGGKSAWEALLAGLDGNRMYLEGELLHIRREGHGYTISEQAARTTGNGINFQFGYYLLDGTRDSARRDGTLLAPSAWPGAFKRFGESASALSKGISLADAGMLMYSEYNQEKPVFRDVTGTVLVEMLKTLAETADDFALTGGNAYTWAAADTLYSVPLGASGYLLQSAEVPFYQMAVHGYIEYSGEPMNAAADKTETLLRSVEYGALPHYSGIYAESAATNRSVLDTLFSAHYGDWLATAEAQARIVGDIYEKIAGARMTGHKKVSEGVYTTAYDNGVSVTVDYNAGTVRAEGAGA
jgi:hypothetical protein